MRVSQLVRCAEFVLATFVTRVAVVGYYFFLFTTILRTILYRARVNTLHTEIIYTSLFINAEII